MMLCFVCGVIWNAGIEALSLRQYIRYVYVYVVVETDVVDLSHNIGAYFSLQRDDLSVI